MKTSARFAVTLSTALLLGGSAAALGAPTLVGTVATKTVRLVGFDISTADGAQTLYERIVMAARAVCRDTEARVERDCRARAIADAVSRVGSPLLSAAHRSTVERVEEVVRR
jgi:UrcA family protein